MHRRLFTQDWTVTRSGDGVPTPVALPHDAMLAEVRDPQTPNGHHTGYYPGGIYRYAKRFVAPPEWSTSKVFLEFEGVYMRSEVYLNGVLVGGRPSGYAEFLVDLAPALRPGEENLVEVIANNPSGPNSRWYSGSGIYRPVHLVVADRLHLEPEGARIRTLEVGAGTASLEVTAAVVNEHRDTRSTGMRVELVDADGVVVASADTEGVDVPADGVAELKLLLDVPSARLWSVEDPYLYQARVVLESSEGIVDEADVTVGIRTVTVDASQGLLINGRSVTLRGACVHHDNGVIGATTLDAAEERRVRILKDSGYNAIRSAHNPMSRAMLRACDRLGMLVMDELTDEWWRLKTRAGWALEFDDWWREDLIAMVRKDLNHPSVIMYSIGNEIAEVATPRGERLGYDMVAQIREIDPSRLVTNGINYFLSFIAPLKDPAPAEDTSAAGDGKEKQDPEQTIALLNFLMGVMEKVTPYLLKLPRASKRTFHAQNALDVAGYNYGHSRWAADAKKYPDRVVVATETFPGTAAELWHLIETMPQAIGEFVWTGWDYIGEAGIATQQYDDKRRLFQPYPALLAGVPLVDITGYRQPWSYYTQILWGLRSAPYLAVRPLDRAGRKRTKNNWRPTDAVASWTWPGFEGVRTTVEVYARASRVDLLLDGHRVATKKLTARDAFRVEIPLDYQPGRLEVVAYDANGQETGRDALVTAGDETVLRAAPESARPIADGDDLIYVTVELTDDRGVVKPLHDRMVRVEVAGEATLLGFGSAAPTTTEQLSAPEHSTYRGRAQAVLRTTGTPGPIMFTAQAEGLEPARVNLVSVPGA